MMSLSSLVRIWGECLTIHSMPVFFFLFFFKVEISSHASIPLFVPGSVHLGSASWDDCGQMYPEELHVSCFWQVPTLCPDSGIVSSLRPCWVKGTYIRVCLVVTCYLHFWQNDWGLLCATVVRLEQTPNKSQHTKVTLEKKILLSLLPGFELAIFNHKSSALTNL